DGGVFVIEELLDALRVKVAGLDLARGDFLEQQLDAVGLAQQGLGRFAAKGRRVSFPGFQQQRPDLRLRLGGQGADGGEAQFLRRVAGEQVRQYRLDDFPWRVGEQARSRLALGEGRLWIARNFAGVGEKREAELRGLPPTIGDLLEQGGQPVAAPARPFGKTNHAGPLQRLSVTFLHVTQGLQYV